ncbi:MAG: nitroreductase family protein [Ilumatobacteraceae bacterium]
MTEFADVVRRRRMTRAFRRDPLPPGTIEHLVDLAARAPSAGKTQGWRRRLEAPGAASSGTSRCSAERRSGGSGCSTHR